MMGCKSARMPNYNIADSKAGKWNIGITAFCSWPCAQSEVAIAMIYLAVAAFVIVAIELYKSIL
jgi:hypothetical protein